MGNHQSAKPSQATLNGLNARRRQKLRQHAVSLAISVIVFVVLFCLMQAVNPPATAATTVAVSSSPQPVAQVPPLSSSGSAGTGTTSAGAEESEPAPARTNERAVLSPGPTIAAQIMGMPSVYMHVLSENAREKARLLASELEKKGIALAGIKIVSDGPRTSDVRYFRPSEKEEAMQVQAALLSLDSQMTL